MRVQRTQAVGQLFWQHGNHAARKIHAGGAVVSINVNGAAGLHIVTHIGNGHQQAPPFATADLGGLAIYGVIKIAGVFTINRHQRDVGQVHAVDLVPRPDRIGQGARQGHGLIAELMRYPVLAHCNFNLHARIVNFAQHLFHAADWLTKQRGRFRQLNHNDLSGFCRTGRAFGNQHVLSVTFVFRRYQPHTALMQQSANDGIGRTLKNFGHTPFRAIFSIVPHDTCLDTVFVQDGAHFVWRQIDVTLTVISLHKTVAISVARHSAFEFSKQARGVCKCLRA